MITLVGQAIEWAKTERLPDGRRVIDQEWVQLNLARVRAGLEFLRQINWKVASSASLDISDASTIKIFGTEFYLEAFRLLMEILGPRAYLQRNSAAEVVQGRLEMSYRSLVILTFGVAEFVKSVCQLDSAIVEFEPFSDFAVSV